MDNFSSKMAGEVQLIHFDFSEFLQPEEKITFATVEVKANKAKDPEFKNFIYGSAHVDGSVISQRVTGGKEGVSYKLTATAETNAKQILKLQGTMEVISDSDEEIEIIIPEQEDIPVPAIEEKQETHIESIIPTPIEDRQVKVVPFTVINTKEINRDGANYGIVEGYASTYGNVDRTNDVVIQGAFTKSVDSFRKGNRQIRMYYQHEAKEIIGGFNPNYISEDSQGLKVVGEINLDVQRGREVYALAKQGVLGDFSIGYSVKDFEIKSGVRQLKEIELWEISIVTEPANPKARILQVKKSDVEHISSKREMEKLLRESGFSRSASSYLASLADESKFSDVHKTEDTQRDAAIDTKSTAQLLLEITSLVKKM